MDHGKHRDGSLLFQEEHAVRKAMHERTTDPAADHWTALRALADLRKGAVERVHELDTQSGPLRFVPGRSISNLSRRAGGDGNFTVGARSHVPRRCPYPLG